MNHRPSKVGLFSDSPEGFFAAFEAAGLDAKPARLVKVDNQPSNHSKITNFVGELLTGGIETVLLVTAHGTRSLIHLSLIHI